MANMKGNMTFMKGNMALIKGNMVLIKGNIAPALNLFFVTRPLPQFITCPTCWWQA